MAGSVVTGGSICREPKLPTTLVAAFGNRLTPCRRVSSGRCPVWVPIRTAAGARRRRPALARRVPSPVPLIVRATGAPDVSGAERRRPRDLATGATATQRRTRAAQRARDGYPSPLGGGASSPPG